MLSSNAAMVTWLAVTPAVASFCVIGRSSAWNLGFMS
jgi:hypothetical protein